MAAPQDKHELSEIQEVAAILDQNKAEDIKLLDLTAIHGYLDYFVIATALSSVHLKKLAVDVQKHMKAHELKANRPTEDDIESGWVILDFRDFVVHLFLKEKRQYYDLEKLWKDARKIDW